MTLKISLTNSRDIYWSEIGCPKNQINLDWEFPFYVPKIGQKYGSMDSGFDDSKVLDDSKVISNGTNFDNPKFYADACIFAGHVSNFCDKSYF